MTCEGCARRKASLRKLAKRVDKVNGKAEAALALALIALILVYTAGEKSDKAA